MGRSVVKNLNGCPICGSGNTSRRYVGYTYRCPSDNKKWQVFHCHDCKHGYLNPQLEWTELEPYYSSSYPAYELHHGSSVADDKATVQQALEVGEFRHLPLPNGKRLLDVGCGGGYFLRISKMLGATVKGIEPSAAGAKVAQESGLDVFHGMLDDYVRQKDAGADFDIITANHVLEHAPEPVTTLLKMKKLLADNGMIWISVPNASGFFATKLQEDWNSSDLPLHLHQFSMDSLVLAGEKSGLKVKRIYTSSLPSALAHSLRVYLRKRFFIPQRLTERIGWLNRDCASRLATRLDRRNQGEAIIVEFCAAA